MPIDIYPDFAVSTRVRLARNLAGYPFYGMDTSGNGEIADMVYRTVKPLGDFCLIKMSELGDERAACLTDKHMISPLLRSNPATGALVMRRDEAVSIMVNEEDHLRIQCVLGGFCLGEVYDNLAYLDKKLSERMNFAVDEDYGYVTSCLTNIGTGMRASVMLFLPALTKAGRMGKIINELSGYGLTVRGAYGEGTSAEGMLYQVSNEVTLRYTERQILGMVEFATRKLSYLERQAREELISSDPVGTEDSCRRAYGILTNCKKLGYDEFSELYVRMRLGAYYGFFETDVGMMDSLLTNLRPAVINYIEGGDVPEDILRAETVKAVIRLI